MSIDSRFAWRDKIPPSVVTVVTFFVAMVVIAARRPDQIAFPEVWNEEGMYVVPLLIQYGWSYILVPINGYLIIPAKTISYLALRTSFVYYPAISTVLSVATQALCVTAVARAPTVMPARFAMAAALLFVPINPEPFVLTLYTLWWTPLLLFVAFLWAGKPGSLWRYLFVIVGGISAPVIISTLPAFVVNAAWKRRTPEMLLLMTAAIVAGMQAYYIATTGATINMFRVELLPLIVPKFFGIPMSGGLSGSLFIGLLIAGLLAAGVFLLPKQERVPYCLLGTCLLGAIVSSTSRAPLEILHPFHTGPRYFFYPFVLEIWMLIWLAARTSWPFKVPPVLILLAIAPMSVPTFQRHQERLTSWTENAVACRSGVDVSFQIQWDGTPREAVAIVYPGAVCQKAGNNAFLDRWIVPGTKP